MCRSMVDIQSAAAEIRRGKKRRRKKDRNHRMKIYMVSLLHRATIKKTDKRDILIIQHMYDVKTPESSVCEVRTYHYPFGQKHSRTVFKTVVCNKSKKNVPIHRVLRNCERLSPNDVFVAEYSMLQVTRK